MVTLPSFTCPRCGAVSYNHGDIEHGYCGRCHDFTADTHPLRIWVILHDPLDFPGKWVVRIQEPHKGGIRHRPEVWLRDSLEEARAVIPAGLHRFPRDPSDDPKIQES